MSRSSWAVPATGSPIASTRTPTPPARPTSGRGKDQLFGVSLPANIGLTGRGLTGTIDWTTDHFEAAGIPLTPWDDADLQHEQPFQLMQIDAYDAENHLLAATEIVAPVSTEMLCSGCHHPDPGETVEQAILRLHDDENGTQLYNSRPVLCADCHASNALGLPGNPNLPSLSLAMHEQHGEVTNDCYTCHPGPHTQCLRDVMSQEHGMVCQDCHGSVAQVAYSIDELGREPWLEEPRCGDCHGPAYAEEPATLYRFSNNGHGGLYCEACHNSTHAILPSREERDNRQTVALQGHAGTLRTCSVCHGVTPWGPGPHGLYPTGVDDGTPVSELAARVLVQPNPISTSAVIRYRVVDETPVELAIHDVGGRMIQTLTMRSQRAGDHSLVWDGKDEEGRSVPAGVYFCRLTTAGQTATARIVKVDP
ncbi:MAG: FlgD immunoglobulin-like domain containing protein [Candidatus Eisenbacteria bacterium]|nr:FlgD immunoglobulin-like domain containing protein [Candidatus Eisenbacteria bacterium]